MLKSGAKSLLCRNMYNKKDAADLAASFLSFAKSGGVFQQSEKVFPVRFLQHGIDCGLSKKRTTDGYCLLFLQGRTTV